MAEGGESKEKSKPNLSGGIKVSSRQRGNPILKSIRSVPWEFDDAIVPDYIIGQRACAVFLSVRYHTLKPDYIHDRLKELGSAYELRVLLVQVDVKEPHHALKQLMRICILADLTLMRPGRSSRRTRRLRTSRPTSSWRRTTPTRTRSWSTRSPRSGP